MRSVDVRKIPCKVCGIKVLNSWTMKMNHAIKYHPEIILRGLLTGSIQQTCFNIGAKVADGLKGFKGK